MDQNSSLGMMFLRAWMWFVPVAMLVASVGFGVLAAVNGTWGLVAVMGVMGVIALGLLVLHYWVLYGFGRGAS